ncbi:hypothetical protein AALA98_14700 [Lachnospiraceae bacterium 45-W7]
MRYNYNLSGSGRRPLVEAISQILDKPAIYQGAPSFAYIIGDYTVDRNGVLSYDDSIHPDFAAVLISDLRERGFVAENISDADDDATVNHVTDEDPVAENPIEADTFAATEEAPVEEDDTADMTAAENMVSAEAVNPESPDILTIEIPNTEFTPDAKEKLKKIVASKKTVLEKALEADGLPIVEKDGKIDFPWFTLHGLEGEAEAYGCLVAAICKMAKKQKRVTATEKPIENEKFTMRQFLIRLGFIGDEYKTARKILLRNLTGNSSWKSGHKPERNTATVTLPNSAEAAIPTEQEFATPLEETDTAENEPQKEDEGGDAYGK